ncbi:adenylate/guanylate cyclase domain-containing protein [Novosphingobium sp. PS1R-30]|uniref:Adenylate/guanylate cyclase domain-containing protein n=1 Tax=Novosphingobium anseongense TaxID=3133436 RepID=A0ABU8RRL3_9SPHN
MPRLKSTRLLARRIGPARAVLTALLLIAGLLVARYSWTLPFVPVAERSLYDLREAWAAPIVEPDPRVVMVVFNDDTLNNTRKRSPLDRGTLARALRSIDAMGAKGIGIDILIDQEQDEDAELVEALRGMQTPTYLAYASFGSNRDQISERQQQFLDDFQKAIATDKTKATSIRLEVDSDNVVRSWPKVVPGLPPLMARALVPDDRDFATYAGAIRFRQAKFADYGVYNKLPIDVFAAGVEIPALADQIRGKYVLIGGDVIDYDQFETPLRLATEGRTMIGLEVHATILSQLLDKAPFAPVTGAQLWLIALSAILLGALSSMAAGAWWRVGPVLLIQAAGVALLPFWMQARMIDTQNLPVFGWALGWVLAFIAVGAAARAVGAEQRKFAQGALGKYLPRDIANQIIQDPEQLALKGERREIFVIFSDLEGFTELSHALDPQMVATLLNRYLDLLSDVVLAHGGTIDKFVGDAVVAFWGAPISRPDDGERAARAAYAMWQAGEEFRNTAPPGVPPIGRTRVGLHFGEAIVGNFGGEDRIQYTALGDSMNTASRLEAANKKLHTSVIASAEAVSRSGLDWWRPMGRITLRGRATPVDVFEPTPDMPNGALSHIQAILDRLAKGDGGALAELEGLAAASPDDAALANLVYRMQSIKSGGSYVLE